VTKVLVADGLSKKIGKNMIVQPLDVQIESGQIVVLCGGNGAGKSTLIRMLVGVDRPTSGSVKINGIDSVRQSMKYTTNIGYMPDDYQFGQVLTAKESLWFFAKLKGLDLREVERVASKVGLADKLGLNVSAYSKGMRQRLNLAQALLGNPQIIFLDEPTNGLDPLWNEQLYQLFGELQTVGVSIVFSTHDLSFAERIADYGLFMKDGLIVAEGNIGALLDNAGTEGLLSYFK
jgi:ABC-type multidrug transport system ATPase subunit